MRGYILAPQANVDLEEVLLYVAVESRPLAADRLESEFHALMQRLAEAPEIGHARTDLASGTLRFIALHKYMIVYLPDSRPVEIARVFHGARDIAALLIDWPRPD